MRNKTSLSQPKKKEDSSNDTETELSRKGGGHVEIEDKAAPDANRTQRTIQMLLKDLHYGHALVDKSPLSPVNNALKLLCDHAALSKAQERLQSQDKSLDIVFQAHISAMIRILNLFLDLKTSYT